jgi:putative oxidoreductase
MTADAHSDEGDAMKIVHGVMFGYEAVARWAGRVVLSVFLLGMRIVWGWGFFMAGKGKLENIEKPIAFFRDLHIPMPVANAWLVACVECFGGLLLLLGMGSRAVAFALTVNMLVAYGTTEHEALGKLWNDSDPSAVIAAAPFWFLLTAVLVLALGPGWFSVDAAVGLFARKKLGACKMGTREEFVAATPARS